MTMMLSKRQATALKLAEAVAGYEVAGVRLKEVGDRLAAGPLDDALILETEARAVAYQDAITAFQRALTEFRMA